MAIYHLTTKIMSRSKGQSAIAAAAYRSGERLYDEQAAMLKYYPSREDRIVFTDIMAPKNAPEWVHDRDQLWNRVEQAEKRKDSQLAREIEISLPHELTPEQRVWLIKDFAREEFVRKGYAVDIAIHAPDRDSDERNYHAHLLITTRRLGPDGFSLTKESDTERRAKRNAGWTREKELTHWRKQWATLANRHLERHGHEARIDHRSLIEQGIDPKEREPTVHVGYAAKEIAARGAQSDRMDQLNELLARNELRFDLKAIDVELDGLEKQLAEERRQQAAQAQRSASDDGMHRALIAASSARRRQQGWSQIGRSQTQTPPHQPEPRLQKARPAARAAMEQTPTDDRQRQQTPQAPEASVPSPRPEPRPEIVQQAKPNEQPTLVQKPTAMEQSSSDREGWRYDETWGWEKIEDAVARKGREEKPAPPREARTPTSKEPERTKPAEQQQWGYSGKGEHAASGFGTFLSIEQIAAQQAEQAAKTRTAGPAPATRPPVENARTDTRSATPQSPDSSQPKTGITYQYTPEADSYLTPIEHINSAHHAAEQAAAKVREEQQRKKDMADLARAARADDAKMRAPTPSLHGIFGAKVADAIRDDAQKIRAQVREVRQEQTQANWLKGAQGQNPDRVGPREVAGRAVQAGKQAARSSYRVVDRATGVVSSLGDFVGNLLSSSSATPPEQPNRISMHTLATDPEARKQYQLAQHAEAKRRGIAVEALDNIRRDSEAGRDLSAADVSKLPREQQEQILGKGDPYVRELIESSRKRAEEYWKGRERGRD